MLYIDKLRLRDKEDHDQVLNFDIVQFEENDYSYVKDFILNQYDQLLNKDFFIIDDIDSALPEIFNVDGIVCGVLLNNEIVAIQAVDTSKKNHNNLTPYIPKKFAKNRLAEMGWTITNFNFQNMGIASFMISYLESFLSDNYDFVATVHPHNIAALKTYLHNGYIGVNIDNYYGVSRIFLIKQNNISISISEISLEISTDTSLNNLFSRGYILHEIQDPDKQRKFILKVNNYRSEHEKPITLTNG